MAENVKEKRTNESLVKKNQKGTKSKNDKEETIIAKKTRILNLENEIKHMKSVLDTVTRREESQQNAQAQQRTTDNIHVGPNSDTHNTYMYQQLQNQMKEMHLENRLKIMEKHVYKTYMHAPPCAFHNTHIPTQPVLNPMGLPPIPMHIPPIPMHMPPNLMRMAPNLMQMTPNSMQIPPNPMHNFMQIPTNRMHNFSQAPPNSMHIIQMPPNSLHNFRQIPRPPTYNSRTEYGATRQNIRSTKAIMEFNFNKICLHIILRTEQHHITCDAQQMSDV
ncbi:Hypothetical predicted protein [Mytilus galloprovincialis]|uniref:Uncharacterized protein n=1 Tax=Mytilus galloprovincialis TaxID=29158 RepID=A0A8B6EKB1_MYTGA|nr:Hypothetical predicted protein [Mytilus galloprovincialis]